MTTSQATDFQLKPAKGERYKCGSCEMELEVLSDCGCQSGCPQMICCGRQLEYSGSNITKATKDAFVEQIENGLDATQQGVGWLKEKSSEVKDDASDTMNREAERLSDQYEQTKAKLSEIKQASGDAWKDMAAGCAESWESFKASCHKALARYRSSD